MANLKEVRYRITSVNSTQQITSAMKMVSASKLRRAQDAIIKLRPYANKLKEILQNLSSNLDNSSEGAYSKQRKVQKVLLIAISSNRGLCGAFNSNVIKATNVLINTTFAEQFKSNNGSIMTFGKKVSEFYAKRPYPIFESNNQIFDHLTFNNVAPLAEKVMKAFATGNFDKVVIIYNQFKNAAVQILSTEDYLPIVPQENEVVKKSKMDYIFEPNKEEIVSELIPKSLKIQLYKALLDSHAAEHGARMTAMHKATDNAQELLKELRLTYNKARQAAITNEILEIVGGAEALKG
ncbi:MAG: ATP synthase F1 subunit gamma [Bacteroidetes bacterium]|nr:ATP synthase F1 subunit gamma [Bacteroidota bacterium]